MKDELKKEKKQSETTQHLLQQLTEERKRKEEEYKNKLAEQQQELETKQHLVIELQSKLAAVQTQVICYNSSRSRIPVEYGSSQPQHLQQPATAALTGREPTQSLAYDNLPLLNTTVILHYLISNFAKKKTTIKIHPCT